MGRLKITLISPYMDIQMFGIRTLSACLKRDGHDVQIIFLSKHFTKRYKDRTLEEVIKISTDSDLIGISLMTNFFSNAVQITKKLKEELKVPIMWGGIHPTIRPMECLEHADMVCIGEGEEAITELANKMKKVKDFYDTCGLWFNNNGNIIKNKIRPLIQDIDSIPFQDYDYEDHYMLVGEDIRKMDENLLNNLMNRIYMTIGTRGCPFGCRYCCNNIFNKMYAGQNIIRKRSAGNIIKEFSNIKDRFPFIKNFKLVDDVFMIRTAEEIREFCEKYKERIGMPLFIGGVHPSFVTEDKISLLADAGLTNIRMGIQSGSERTKKLYKRTPLNPQVKEAVQVLNNHKSQIKRPIYDIILDNPWDTDEDLIETLMFLSGLPKPYTLGLFSLTFFPETELYYKAKEEGIIKNEMEDVYCKYFHGCKKTYLNKLFYLLDAYSGRISPRVMHTLTTGRLKKPLYALLKAGAVPIRAKYLLKEGMKDIKKGYPHRIIRYIRKR